MMPDIDRCDRAVRLWGFAAELVFPGRCLSCGADLILRSRPFYPLCDACLTSLAGMMLAGGRRCRVCGRPLISEWRICTGCRGVVRHFSDNTSLFEYRGLVRDLLLQYKVGGRRRLALVFADLLAPELKRAYRGLPVVPVPPRPTADRHRGWEHVEMICRRLTRRHDIRIFRCLSRGSTRAQKSLPSEERRRNTPGSSFAFIPGRAPTEQLGGVVLLDDVLTTGATADGCAARLIAGGFRWVRVVTLALD